MLKLVLWRWNFYPFNAFIYSLNINIWIYLDINLYVYVYVCIHLKLDYAKIFFPFMIAMELQGFFSNSLFKSIL
jgi:hypothetical protein